MLSLLDAPQAGYPLGNLSRSEYKNMSNPIAQLDDALRATRQPFDRIPVVDIASLVNGSDATTAAKDIRWAFANAGFMYVKNHGVSNDLIERAYTASKLFFDLPDDVKKLLHIENSGTALRGYIPLFGENTDPTKTSDLKECFDLGPETPGRNTPFFGSNQWPALLPSLEAEMMAYHDAMVRLARTILRGVAISLDLPETFFEAKMRDPISVLRLIHYPPQSGRVAEEMIGIGAHTDYGVMTILSQDQIGGLQVMNRDGQWIEASPLEGTFVINIGDLMQILTNDIYLANMHRVVNTSGRERYSMPFFVEADSDAVFEPLASCVSATNPRKYCSATCGAHMFARYVDSFPHLQALKKSA